MGIGPSKVGVGGMEGDQREPKRVGAGPRAATRHRGIEKRMGRSGFQASRRMMKRSAREAKTWAGINMKRSKKVRKVHPQDTQLVRRGVASRGASCDGQQQGEPCF